MTKIKPVTVGPAFSYYVFCSKPQSIFILETY